MKARLFLIAVGIIILIVLISTGLFLSKRESQEQTDNTVKGDMKLTSSAFINNQSIPVKYTCDGQNVSPPLSISDIPNNTRSLALIMDDPDAPAGTWVHWTVWNIDPTIKEIPEGNIPAGAVEGKTSFGKPGYGGPCPPSGTHHYIFHLYALDSTLSLNSSSTKEDLEKSMEGHILDKAELVGLYSRNSP